MSLHEKWPNEDDFYLYRTRFANKPGLFTELDAMPPFKIGVRQANVDLNNSSVEYWEAIAAQCVQSNEYLNDTEELMGKEESLYCTRSEFAFHEDVLFDVVLHVVEEMSVSLSLIEKRRIVIVLIDYLEQMIANLILDQVFICLGRKVSIVPVKRLDHLDDFAKKVLADVKPGSRLSSAVAGNADKTESNKMDAVASLDATLRKRYFEEHCKFIFDSKN